MKPVRHRPPGVVGVYLAGRYTRREELAEHAAWLRHVGLDVTSRWLDGHHQLHPASGEPLGEDDEQVFEGEDDNEERRQLHATFAGEDLADVESADILVAFTELPRSGASRGGRHVELGMALAWGKRVLVVGPRENVFCSLPRVEHFGFWTDAAAELAASAVRQQAALLQRADA